METVVSFLCENAIHAHLVIFGLLLLAGLNIPLSEDLLVMIGGMLTATCVPGNYYLMLGWLWAGAILSAYEAYWLGHHFGPRLYRMAFFKHVVTPERVDRIGSMLERYGVASFVIVRFIPLGVRNCFFMTCGLWRMPFLRFIWRDAVGAALSVYVLFRIGHAFGSNYRMLVDYFHQYETMTLSLLVVLALGVAAVFWYRRCATAASVTDHNVE